MSTWYFWAACGALLFVAPVVAQQTEPEIPPNPPVIGQEEEPEKEDPPPEEPEKEVKKRDALAEELEAEMGEEGLDVEQLDLKELLGIPLAYGSEESVVQLHLYLTSALWWLEDQAFGDFANAGGSLSGKPSFITYSGYINIRGNFDEQLMAEAEFELYKGQKGQFKVTRLRGVWKPSPYFQLSLGRDFPPIGVQDRVYYPTSELRHFAHAPYLYHSILRATGWWDAGVHLSGHIPLTFIEPKAKLKIDVSAINGPGDQHKDPNFLVDNMKPNADGYMFEAFHANARQPWDNNDDKPIPFRVALSFMDTLEVGGSAMFTKYNEAGDMSADYFFGHLLYEGERLTAAAEVGYLQIEVDPANMNDPNVNGVNGTTGDSMVSQLSAYASIGYKIIYKEWGLQFIEPVIRYEYMDSWLEDTLNKGDRHAIWAGLRLSPSEGWVIKAAYLVQLEAADKLENNGLIVEAVFEF